MQRIWRFLLDSRTLTVIGVAALAGLLLLGADTMKVGLIWVGAVLGLLVVAWLIVWGVRRWRAQRAAQSLEQAMADEADKAVRESVMRRQLLLQSMPGCPAALAVAQLANKIKTMLTPVEYA